MCGMPCEVVRIVACRPPGVPTTPARATSAGPFAAIASAASASSSPRPTTTMRALTLLPIDSPCGSDADGWTPSSYPAGGGFEPPFT